MAYLDRIDPKKDAEGVWLVYDPQPETGIRVRITSMYGDRHQKFIREKRDVRLRDLHQTMTLDDAEAAFTSEAMAHGALVDWEGIQDHETGEALPFTPEAATRILKDPAYRRFKQWLMVQMTTDDHFTERRVAEAAKNSDAA